jgi:hypothetical protein
MANPPMLLLFVMVLAMAEEPVPPFSLVEGFISYRNDSGPIPKESIANMTGAGVCVLDYDVDGDWDLYFPNRGENQLFRNDGGGGFEDVTRSSGVGDDGNAGGCAVGDTDNDGDPDLYVTNHGPNALYRNDGDGTFSRVEGAAPSPGWSTGAAFGDLDNDGLLDLYVANYIDLSRVDTKARCRYFSIDVFCGPNGLPGSPDTLYKNRGGLAFEDVTERAGVYRPDTRGFSVLLVDLNSDGLPEIHVANDATIDLLFENRGGMRFEDVSLESGAGYSASGVEQSGMGSTAGDYDGDSDFDLYVTNFQRDYNTFFRNEGDLFFQDVTVTAGLSLPTLDRLAWGTHSLDVDFDGDLDLFVANGHIYPELVEHPEIGERYAQENQLFLNDGRGRFSETSLADRSIRRVARGTAVSDLDDDGAPDVVVNNLDDVPDLYRGHRGRNWLSVALVGTSTNRDGLGARVRARTGAMEQIREMRLSDGYLGSSEPVLRFGLGEASRVDRLEVDWPSGARDRCDGVDGLRLVRIKEGAGCLP